MPTEKEIEIGKIISTEFEKRRLNPDYVGRIIYGYLGFNPEQWNFETGQLYVKLVLNGFIYGTDGHVARVLKKRISLDRLAILLFAIGIGPNDPLVEMVSKQDIDFVYPPSNGIAFCALKLIHRDLEILAEETASNQKLVNEIQDYLVGLEKTYGNGETLIKVVEDLLSRVNSLSAYKVSFEKI